ncbi:protein starmaker-like isoform X2 [Branchiostoma floridae]|uniref:Protein starmaker-like isoform X2 n=1 Tax=Branchiostoma floridae TaxID=7739 RepID=A0A9J7HPN0_BRAFL|nr:protein starmaker-like isoform X2 [Branchiostoma floridae]
MTTVERAPLVNADEHINASPHHRKVRDDSTVPWADMVHQAIQSAPTGAANLADICQYISENFPHHGSLETVAQSVCRVLSTHKCFQVVSSPREIRWTLNAACDHKLSLPGPSLAAKDRESNLEDSDVTSSTPDGVDSASKMPVSNPNGDDRQSLMAEEEEQIASPASETTCTTMEADTAVHKNDTPESRADDCSDNTVSSSQDEASAVHHVVSSGSGTSSCHTLSMIPEEVRQQNEGSDAMFPSTPYFGDCTTYKNSQAIQSSSQNQVEETCKPAFGEQAHKKSKRKRSHSGNSGTERGSHSQSSDESIIPPSPQEETRSDLVTFARTRRALAIPHTCGKEVDSMLDGGEDAIVSDSDSDSESTVLYYEKNDEDSDTESYVIPNSHDKDDSFNSLTGPKAPVIGASMRSALWTKDHTLVPSLSQHLSSCPVRPCVVLLHRLTADDLKPYQPQKP